MLVLYNKYLNWKRVQTTLKMRHDEDTHSLSQLLQSCMQCSIKAHGTAELITTHALLAAPTLHSYTHVYYLSSFWPRVIMMFLSQISKGCAKRFLQSKFGKLAEIINKSFNFKQTSTKASEFCSSLILSAFKFSPIGHKLKYYSLK